MGEFLRTAIRDRTRVAIKIKDQWVNGTYRHTFKNTNCAPNQVKIEYYRREYEGSRRKTNYKVYHMDDTKHIRLNPNAPCTGCGGEGSNSRKDAAKAILDATPIPEAIAQLISSFVKRVACRTCGKTGTCAEAIITTPEDEPEIDDSSSGSSRNTDVVSSSSSDSRRTT